MYMYVTFNRLVFLQVHFSPHFFSSFEELDKNSNSSEIFRLRFVFTSEESFFKDDCTLQALAEMNGKTVYIRPEVGGSPLLIFLRNHTLGD
jgi:hypothetical protein